MRRRQLAIVGSGFAGSILARIARRLGIEVVLIERQTHPRFALGESSTPLGNLALRRLGERYGLADLGQLSSYGRWLASHPRLRRGLKRGFTFFAHQAGRPFEPGAENENRLLVAASPDDSLADSHWLRSDFDAFLVERARAEGVEIHLGTEVTTVRRHGDALRIEAHPAGGGALVWEVDLLVDATGAGGVTGGLSDGPSRLDPRPRSGLIYGHFGGLGPFVDSIPGGRASLEPGPYPDDRAAVHHLIEEGWVYALPFDHDCVSVGWVRPGRGEEIGEGTAEPPAERLRALFAGYPSLAAQFAGVRPLVPVRAVARLQHRMDRAAGSGWALLPHAYAFFDPIFSTGIAWSLLGVERLARIFEGGFATPDARPRRRSQLERYAGLLAAEADRLETLTLLAYRSLARPRRLFDLSMLYFAAVSWAEVRQRIEPGADESACWEGFLGVGDPVLDSLFDEAPERLEAAVAGRRPDDFGRWLRRAIAPRNLVGLADPGRRNLYPVDLGVVIENAALLGRSRRQMRKLAPRLTAT